VRDYGLWSQESSGDKSSAKEGNKKGCTKKESEKID
jgi:hypothetical protein